MFTQLTKNDPVWGKLPDFQFDAPYYDNDETWKYLADELRRYIAWLETEVCPGHKFDINTFRPILAKQEYIMELWHEFNRLMMCKPAPYSGWRFGDVAWKCTQHIPIGQKKTVALFERMVAETEEKVKNGVGFVPNERIRIYWPDLRPQWSYKLEDWLAKEYGAVVVCDNQSIDPYEPIDLSTEQTIFEGLAKRWLLSTPMVRQSHGGPDVQLQDLIYGVKEFQADCVIWPGHRGHKDQSASANMMRECCRDLGVPLLHLNTDVFDERITPLDKIKQQISEFFENTGLA